METSDGTVEIATRLTPDVIRVTGTPSGEAGPTYIVDLAQGQYMLLYQDIWNGEAQVAGRTAYSYPESAGDLAAPAPDSVVTLDALVFEGGNLAQETHTHVFGPLTQVTAGPCTYDAIEAQVTYDIDPGVTEGYIYLPELGLGYLAWFEGMSGRSDYPLTRIYVP